MESQEITTKNINDVLNSEDNLNSGNSINIEHIPLKIDRGFFSHKENLTRVILNDCQLKKFPRSILKLTNLEYLDLSNNSDIKFIPIEIGNLEKLNTIKYEGTQCRPLTDFIHVSEFHDLIEISRYIKRCQEITHPERKFITYNNENCIIVMSYNILSPKYAIQEIYPLCIKEFLNFDARLPKIIDEIKKYRPNIVCLQEVQAGLFETHFKPEFEALGYKGLYTPKDMYYKAKEQDKPTIIGQATFIKNADFTIINELKLSFKNSPYLKQGRCPKKTKKYSDSAQIVIVKTDKLADHAIAIVNLHLQWKPTCDDVRADQLKIAVIHAIELAKQTSDTYDVIVAGDYNSYPDTEAIAFMNNHPEKFVSTYSEMNQPFFLTHLTCDFDGCIDYIYTTQNKLEVSSVLPLYDDKTLHEISIEIPDKYHPSDHFPIAAALKFKL